MYDNTMKHLSESILSKKTGIYGLVPTSDSIVRWLDSRNFKKFPDGYSHDENCYRTGTNDGRIDWIIVHSKNTYGLSFLFDQEEKVANIEYYKSITSKGINISFEEATKILNSMVK